MRFRLISDVSGFEQLQPHWDRLHAANPSLTMFNSWTWCFQWWKTYGQSLQLHILVCESESPDRHKGGESELLAIAPLYIAEQRMSRVLRNRSVLFIGSGGDTSPDYHNFIVPAGANDDVYLKLLEFLVDTGGYDTVALGDMSMNAPVHRAVTGEGVFGDGLVRLEKPKAISYAELPASLEGYRKIISRNSHKQNKRRYNRMQQQGGITLELVNDTASTLTAFEALVELHLARWHDKGETGTFRTERYLDFHRSIIRKLSAEGQVWMVVMRDAETIIGVEYMFHYDQVLYFFQTGFSPHYKHLSPGHLMIMHAIEHAIEAGVTEIDMLKGEYPYKQSYAPLTRYTQGVYWYKPGLLSINVRLRSRLSGWLKV